MSLLSWYPLAPAEFRKAVGPLPAERQGFLRVAMDAAWESSDHPCALPDDDDALDIMLGGGGKAGVAVVRRYFKPDPQDRGWLRWPWFTALYQEQLAKFEKRSSAGARGGRARADQSRDIATVRAGIASSNGSGKSGNGRQILEGSSKADKEKGSNAEALLSQSAAVGRGVAPAAQGKSTAELRAMMACDPLYANRVEQIITARVEAEQVPDRQRDTARMVYLFEALHTAYGEIAPGVTS